jgi:hypothetical protein
MGVASCLDILAARGLISREQVDAGKHILVRLVPLVLGLRGYLDETDGETNGAG